MKDDHRTDQPPRVGPDDSDVDWAVEKPTRAGNIVRSKETLTKKTASMQSRPRPKQTNADRAKLQRDAERLYPDEDYYRKPSSQGKRSGQPGTPTRSTKSGRPKKLSRKALKKKRDEMMRSVFLVALSIVLAMLVSFLLNTFVFQIVRVSGNAMYAALVEGDWVLVTKFDYWGNSPERGDIVAVNVSGPNGGTILRRIIGLPEERLEIDMNGDTLINGAPIGERYVTLKNYDGYPEITLSRGRYFAMSDNRTVKLDSRDENVDVISKVNIVGKVRTILWPFSRRGMIG